MTGPFGEPLADPNYQRLYETTDALYKIETEEFPVYFIELATKILERQNEIMSLKAWKHFYEQWVPKPAVVPSTGPTGAVGWCGSPGVCGAPNFEIVVIPLARRLFENCRSILADYDEKPVQHRDLHPLGATGPSAYPGYGLPSLGPTGPTGPSGLRAS